MWPHVPAKTITCNHSPHIIKNPALSSTSSRFLHQSKVRVVFQALGFILTDGECVILSSSSMNWRKTGNTLFQQDKFSSSRFRRKEVFCCGAAERRGSAQTQRAACCCSLWGIYYTEMSERRDRDAPVKHQLSFTLTAVFVKCKNVTLSDLFL